MRPGAPWLVAGLALACAGPPPSTSARGLSDFDPTASNVVDSFVLPRLARLGIAPRYAGATELMRRAALDLAGRLPTREERAALAGAVAGEIVDHYLATPEFVAMGQMIAADQLRYSDDTQFSTAEQIEALNAVVGRLYAGRIGYGEFAAEVLDSRAFLSRFTSSADRCTAAFSLFLGFEPVTRHDYVFGNVFNGYELSHPRARPGEPGYHDYEWTGVCDRPSTPTTLEVCEAALWGMEAKDARSGARMMARLPVFAEHAVELTWRRLIGAPIDRVAPELTVALADGFEARHFDLRWLIREISSSAAYTQAKTYRPDDLVLE